MNAVVDAFYVSLQVGDVARPLQKRPMRRHSMFLGHDANFGKPSRAWYQISQATAAKDGPGQHQREDLSSNCNALQELFSALYGLRYMHI